MPPKVVKVETKVSGDCPWCSYSNSDLKVGPAHEAVESKIVATSHGALQCETCGKIWDRNALGQPWSLELERGDAWARENRARQLSR